MPAFTAIASAASLLLSGGSIFGGGALTIAGLSASTWLSFGLTVASIAYSAYQQQQMRSAAKRAKLAAMAAMDAQGFRFSGRGTAQPWQTAYGRVFKSGNIFFEQVKPPFYYVGVVLASHEIDGIEKLFINGREISLDSAGYVTSKPFFDGDGAAVTPNISGLSWDNNKSRCRVSVRLGKDDQAADPILVTDWPSLGATFRQQGHATMVLKCHYGTDNDDFQRAWSSEAPTPQAIFRGKKVYDPRDAVQDENDKTTWKWSLSPTLCGTDYLRSDFGGRLSTATYAWKRTAESATVEDTAVVTKAGVVEAQYVCSAVIETSMSAVDGLRQFMLCNRSRFISTPSGMAIMAWRWSNSVFTIHDGILAGPFDYQSDTARKDLVNMVRTRIVDPGSNYLVVDGPSYEIDAMISDDGQRYEVTLDLSFSPGASRAQRLTKAFVEDARRGRSLKIPLDIEAMCLEPGDTVTVDLGMTTVVNGTYSVESVAFSESYTGVTVSLVETAPEIGYFNPEVDEVAWSSPAIEVNAT